MAEALKLLKKKEHHKKRIIVKKKVKRQNFIFPKRFPATGLFDIPMNNLHDAMIDFLQIPNLLKGDIRAINILTNILPYNIAHDFFIFMQQRHLFDLDPAMTMFLQIKKVYKVIQQSKDFLLLRKAIGVKPKVIDPFKRATPYKYVSSGDLQYLVRARENLKTFSNAPWVSGVLNRHVETVEIVSKGREDMITWINRDEEEIVDGWNRIKPEWLKETCFIGRKFQPNNIGYLLIDGSVITETQELFDASKKWLSRNKPNDSCPLAIKMDRCAKDYSIAPWAVEYYGPIKRIVSKNVPDMVKWIGKQIPNKIWHTIKQSWFQHVCENGRVFLPGIIGYQLHSGKIIIETKELYMLSNSAKAIDFVGKIPEQIISRCVADAKSALWANEPGIIGIVAKLSNATKPWIPIVKSKHGDTQIPIVDDWYPLKVSWYKEICNNGRVSGAGEFGYRHHSGKVIPESQENFEKSIAIKTFVDYAKLSTNDDSHTNAFYLLRHVLDDTQARELIEFLPKKGTVTNGYIADKVAHVYVLASKLISEPQIHLKRIERNQYIPGALFGISKEMALPEVYLNPARNPENDDKFNWSIMDKIIQDAKDKIIHRFIGQVSGKLGKRISERPVARAKNLPSSQVEVCSDDPIYYSENDTLYCFDRRLLKDTNPITKEKFKGEFRTFQKKIKDFATNDSQYFTDVAAQPGIIPAGAILNPGVRTIVRTVEKTPNLLEKFKSSLLLVYCNNCTKLITSSAFTSVWNNDVVKFCNSACFENFNFSKR